MALTALLCWPVSAIAGGSDRLGVFSGPLLQPGVTQPDLTKPYYYQPPPSNLNSIDELRLRAYRNQLYWQQQDLRLRQSAKPLTPEQQRILNQTQKESDRVNSLLAPSLKTPLPSPGAGTTVLPPPLIPAR
jgi:hypothetical protein